MAKLPPQLYSLVASMSESEIDRLMLVMSAPTSRSQHIVRDLLTDEAACGELLAMMQLVNRMPEGSAARWGKKAAEHQCNSPYCLCYHARTKPEVLDSLRERLQRAKENADEASALRAAVPERVAKRLKHVEVAGRARSEMQARVVVAATAHEAAERAAGRGTDAQVHAETPEEAASNVRVILGELGCCVRGAAAVCHGYCGTSNDFLYHASARAAKKNLASGGEGRKPSRQPSIDNRRALGKSPGAHIIPGLLLPRCLSHRPVLESWWTQAICYRPPPCATNSAVKVTVVLSCR